MTHSDNFNPYKSVSNFMNRYYSIVLSLLVSILYFSCCKDEVPGPDPEEEVEDIVYTQTPYELDIPSHFPQPNIPTDNPLTNEGVELGRMLFYDPILSADSTMGCFSCHLQENAFTDPKIKSIGIDGLEGNRNSMPLFNLSYGFNTTFTWDGSKQTLEQQSLEPIENPIELHQMLPDLIERLKNHPDYPELFKKAFNEAPSEDLVGNSIAQFMRTLISANSRYDQFITPGSGVVPTELELKGWNFFNLETNSAGDSECTHCHGGTLFTEFTYENNGLTETTSIEGFSDPGRGNVTGFNKDYGRFKVPSLRNVALTAPYMHDGRFATLEEVIDHYSEGVHNSPTLSPDIGSEFTAGGKLLLSMEQKQALLAFLNTLTDTTFINNPKFSNPFK